jgi:heterodisulfide reductase subunit A-like polyferredoxin
MGCGICVSECPNQAITLKHCTDAQILAKIDALLDPNDASLPFPIEAG